MSHSLGPHGLQPTRLLCPQNSLGKKTWKVAIPFSRGSSLPKNRTQVSCIASRLFIVWATRKAQFHNASSRICHRPLMESWRRSSEGAGMGTTVRGHRCEIPVLLVHFPPGINPEKRGRNGWNTSVSQPWRAETETPRRNHTHWHRTRLTQHGQTEAERWVWSIEERWLR